MKTRALNQLKTHSTLQEIISAHKSTESLLRSIGIQTETNEKKTLLQICTEKQWNEEELLSWLRKKTQYELSQNESEREDFSQLSNKELLKAVRIYRSRLTTQLNELEPEFHRVCKVHGNQYPIIKEMHWHLNKITEKLRFTFMTIDKTITPLLMSHSAENKEILDGDVKKYNRGVELLIQDQHQIVDHIQKINKMNSHPEKIEGVCATMKMVFNDMENLFAQVDTLYELLHNGVMPKLNRLINKS